MLYGISMKYGKIMPRTAVYAQAKQENFLHEKFRDRPATASVILSMIMFNTRWFTASTT